MSTNETVLAIRDRKDFERLRESDRRHVPALLSRYNSLARQKRLRALRLAAVLERRLKRQQKITLKRQGLVKPRIIT